MSDEWRKSQDAWERLKWARSQHFGTAEDAAQALGMKGVTYRSYERAPENAGRAMSADLAESFGRKFKVSWTWLLRGEGKPHAERQALCEVVGKVGADPEGRILYSTGDRPIAYAPVPPGGNERQPVLLVVGDSMPTFAPNGSLIYLEDQRNPPGPEMLGEVVATELENGEVLLKRLLRGSQPGLWDLESVSGPTRRDERLVWAAFIACIVPPRAARRIMVDFVEAA